LFGIVDHAEAYRQNIGDDALFEVVLNSQFNFGNVDIYVEHGDVVLENITITGDLRITAVNGDITLINVDVPASRIFLQQP